MKRQLLAACCAIAALTIGCSPTKRPDDAPHTFTPAAVPAEYRQPQARAAYLAMHFWDGFDFRDTAFVGSAAGVTEHALVDYFNAVFPNVPYDVAAAGIRNLLDRAVTNRAMYAFFTSKMEQYLFNPASPMRNEEYFIPTLQHMLATDSLDRYRKARAQAMLEEVVKNRPGTPAADIHYATASGGTGSLYALKTDFVLIFFHNLDCGNCRQLAAAISASPIVSELMKRGRLTVLAIYPDMAADMWRQYLPQMPSAWTHGYDRDLEIANNHTYILRVLPALYLVDRDHRVVMKDAAFPYVEQYLANILNPPSIMQPRAAQ